MEYMFFYAKMFDGDISKWDVGSVTDMSRMFCFATAFKQKLCGVSWVRSQASKIDMFSGSSGSILQTVCTSAKRTLATMENTRRYVSRRPNPERELITRTPISTPSIIPAIAHTKACPMCGMFEKSGRLSCCAPGGAWYKDCGGAGNIHVEHRWIEGLKACERTSMPDDM